MPIPPEIAGQKYISLASFRKNGDAVLTPVWFGEKDGKIYVMTRSDSGKYKRIRNNPKVRIAPCTMRGKITGPGFAASARVLPEGDWPWARKLGAGDLTAHGAGSDADFGIVPDAFVFTRVAAGHDV